MRTRLLATKGDACLLDEDDNLCIYRRRERMSFVLDARTSHTYRTTHACMPAGIQWSSRCMHRSCEASQPELLAEPTRSHLMLPGKRTDGSQPWHNRPSRVNAAWHALLMLGPRHPQQGPR